MRFIKDTVNPPVDPPRRRRRRQTSTGVSIADKVYETPMTDREMREARLVMEAGSMQSAFIDPELAQEGLVDPTLMKESDPQAKGYIEDELFGDVGYTQVYDKETGKMRPVSSTDDAWSAATTTKLAKAFDPEFQGSARHSDYIRRGFQGEGNYEAGKISKRTDFKPGDILFQGRRDKAGNPLGPQTYKEFKKDAKGKGEYGSQDGYGSHTDIITGTGVDEKGRRYYNVQGGNASDGLRIEKFYANELAKRYQGRLTQ